MSKLSTPRSVRVPLVRGPIAAWRHVRTHSFWLSTRKFSNSIWLASADTTALALALVGGGACRHFLWGYAFLPVWSWGLLPAWWFGAALTGLLPGWGLSAVDHLKRLAVLVTVLFSIGTIGIFFFHVSDTISRLSIAVAWILAIVLIPAGRAFTRAALCNAGVYGIPTVIYGRLAAATDAAERLFAERGLGYNPIGICTDDPAAKDSALPICGKLLDPAPLAPAALVVLKGLDEKSRHVLVEQVLASYRNLLILPDLGEIPSLVVSTRDLGGLLGLEISQTILNPHATRVKRLVDLVLVSITAPFWIPLCGIICAAIWMEDHSSPIYRQARIGRGGRSFFAYKCRTMVPKAEETLARHLAKDARLRKEWETHFKLKRDPRITRIGRFLRRTSLDELPQLFNVLFGDMSLVGPRPLPPYHLEKISPEIRIVRTRMRPGLTGLWQVSGRSDTGSEGMSRWDPYYVRNWSMWLDIVIIVRTVRAVLLGSGAR